MTCDVIQTVKSFVLVYNIPAFVVVHHVNMLSFVNRSNNQLYNIIRRVEGKFSGFRVGLVGTLSC